MVAAWFVVRYTNEGLAYRKSIGEFSFLNFGLSALLWCLTFIHTRAFVECYVTASALDSRLPAVTSESGSFDFGLYNLSAPEESSSKAGRAMKPVHIS